MRVSYAELKKEMTMLVISFFYLSISERSFTAQLSSDQYSLAKHT